MDRGFQKSWTLILITMCLMAACGLLMVIPFFERHQYAALCVGELSIVLPTLIGMFMLRNEPETGDSVFKMFSPSLIPILIILPCMQTFLIYLTLPVQTLLYEILGERPDSVAAVTSVGEFFVQLLTICLIPAVVEEFLCRGVIMRMLKPYGIVVSMVVSALAFTILHMDLYSFIIIFMLGMLLSAVKILTGSIWACVLVHFSNNLWAVVSTFINAHDMKTAIIAINILSVILFPAAFLMLVGKTRKNVIGYKEFKKKKMGFSLEMLICLLLFAGMTVAGQII